MASFFSAFTFRGLLFFYSVFSPSARLGRLGRYKRFALNGFLFLAPRSVITLSRPCHALQRARAC